MSTSDNTALYQQETEFEITKLLMPFIKNKTFIDVGAEKGTFAQALMEEGYIGTLFEPMQKHAELLEKLTQGTNCRFLPYAITDHDGTATFHIACDDEGVPLDYFHSLQPLQNDLRVHHKKSMPVTCRSLNSLCDEGLIPREIGILKTDTEGNDLNVLKGLNQLKTEVLICEFFMPGLYAGWEQGNPYNLIEEAKKMGFHHHVVVKRIEEYELVSIDTMTFMDKQWGNIVFIKDDLFAEVADELAKIAGNKEVTLFNTFFSKSKILEDEITLLRNVCEERLALINRLDQALKTQEKAKTR